MKRTRKIFVPKKKSSGVYKERRAAHNEKYVELYKTNATVYMKSVKIGDPVEKRKR